MAQKNWTALDVEEYFRSRWEASKRGEVLEEHNTSNSDIAYIPMKKSTKITNWDT